MIPSPAGTPARCAPEREGVAASSGWRHGVLRWWPIGAGLALGVAVLLDVQPWAPAGITTWWLPVLALIYLIFGAARGQLGRPGVLRLQTAALLGFGAIALIALFLDPAVGHYVVAAGWFGHAMWDVAHHRDLAQHCSTGVVPRWYAEACFVVDLLVGAALIVVPTL
ncbi:MAG: hypothetical protein ACRDS0_26400 [Pseudonocardiaceae bacterium]